MHLATVNATGEEVTVTREIGADQWGAIISDERVSVPFTYSGDIQPNETETTGWASSTGEFGIEISGREKHPAYYGPSKSGNFSFNDAGEPMISWTFKSPVGPHQAGSVRLVDQIGPGQSLNCGSFSGTIRRWDQSFESGKDSWVSGFNWKGGAPENCGGQGFAGVVAQEIPAPIAGGNVAILESERATNLAYLLLNCTVRVTDLSLVDAEWTNTMQWEADGETRTFPATLRYPGTATGNRQLVIEKVAIGPDKKFKDETFDINVHCTVADKPVPGTQRQ